MEFPGLGDSSGDPAGSRAFSGRKLGSLCNYAADESRGQKLVALHLGQQVCLFSQRTAKCSPVAPCPGPGFWGTGERCTQSMLSFTDSQLQFHLPTETPSEPRNNTAGPVAELGKFSAARWTCTFPGDGEQGDTFCLIAAALILETSVFFAVYFRALLLALLCFWLATSLLKMTSRLNAEALSMAP